MQFHQKKGKKAEIIFERACKELISEKKILKFIREDISGQDFILFFPNQKETQIEVKSSYDGEIFHKLRHKTKVIVISLQKAKIPQRKIRKLVKITKARILDIADDS